MYLQPDWMILVNTFEETFGDQHGSGKGVWSELGTEVSTNLCQTVVSLASFSGNCTVISCSVIPYLYLAITKQCPKNTLCR
jgi:hypothetical protein